ncbi:MAG TPA: hypothetical protein VFF54_00635 [Thermodesulfobacteriota bacterium]|nr:hypothetical protein [Thermodesulfobacteriota bacterium]
MKLGLNQNVPYKGELYHVQTEDGGKKNPFITTVVFKAGVVFGSRKTSYSDILKFDKLDLAVGEIMDEQHNAVIKDLKSGAFHKPKEPKASAIPRAAAKAEDKTNEESVDDIINQYLSLSGEEKVS